jgi:hypothetical protein
VTVVAGASVVDWNALGKVVLYSLIAGVGVSLAFGIAIAGSVRFADLRREGRGALAGAYVVCALLGLAVSVAAVAYGIYLMTQK